MNLMKAKSMFIALLIVASFVGFTSFTTESKAKSTETSLYNVALVSHTQTGSNFEYTWSVTNPNPGNGSNGTIQNLSHWSLAISEVVELQDIVAVEYSYNGTTWYSLPIVYAIDKSQDCLTTKVLKFDAGTSGSEPTYYRVVMNQDYVEGTTTANFKSGTKTGCYNASVPGMSTEQEAPIR
jgi:hypothetical protein